MSGAEERREGAEVEPSAEAAQGEGAPAEDVAESEMAATAQQQGAAPPREDEAAPAESGVAASAQQQGAPPPPQAEGRAAAGGEPTSSPPERRRRGRFGRRRVCTFCVEKVDVIDHKDPVKLRQYLSDRGKIDPRRKTGTCARHQRRLSIALKRARHLALLPYTAGHIREAGAFAPRQ